MAAQVSRAIISSRWPCSATSGPCTSGISLAAAAPTARPEPGLDRHTVRRGAQRRARRRRARARPCSRPFVGHDARDGVVLDDRPDNVVSLIFAGECLSVPRYIEDANALISTLTPSRKPPSRKPSEPGTTKRPNISRRTWRIGCRAISCATRRPITMSSLRVRSLASARKRTRACGGRRSSSAPVSSRPSIAPPTCRRCVYRCCSTPGNRECRPETAKEHAALTPGAELVVIPNAAHLTMIDAPGRATTLCALSSLALNAIERRHATARSRGSPIAFRENSVRLFTSSAVVDFVLTGAARAQITENPLPEPIQKRGIVVQIRDVERLPETRNLRPVDQDVTPTGCAREFRARVAGQPPLRERLARVPVPRRGRQDVPRPGTSRPRFRSRTTTGSRAGSSASCSTRSSRTNGLLYTVHSEKGPGNPAKVDFVPPGFTAEQATYHNVITEWHARDPGARKFEGTRRELLRVAHIVQNLTHPYGDVEFNPTARPGSPDYGLLYTSGSDLGFSNGGGPNANNPGQTQRLDSLVTAILRIDPRSPQVTPDERPRRLHDPGRQEVRRGRRPEDARRDLCIRLPQRAPPVVGSR